MNFVPWIKMKLKIITILHRSIQFFMGYTRNKCWNFKTTLKFNLQDIFSLNWRCFIIQLKLRSEYSVSFVFPTDTLIQQEMERKLRSDE